MIHNTCLLIVWSASGIVVVQVPILAAVIGACKITQVILLWISNLTNVFACEDVCRVALTYLHSSLHLRLHLRVCVCAADGCWCLTRLDLL